VTVTRIPGIPYGPLPRVASVSGSLTWPPKVIVIHDTGHLSNGDTGYIVPAADEAHYAATRTDSRDRWTSCTAYIDENGPLGSSPLDRVCWAAFSWANHHGLHFEMCGMNTGRNGAVPAATIAHTARLVAQVADLVGIAKVKLSPADIKAIAGGTSTKTGICGHYDITRGLGVGDHDDPGPAFDWAAFMGLVRREQLGVAMATTDDVYGLLVNELLGASVDRRNALIWWIRALADQDDPLLTAKDIAGQPVSFGRPPGPGLKQLAAQLAAIDIKVGQPAPVELSEADLRALAAQLEAAMSAKVDALSAKLDKVLSALAAAGREASS